MDTTRTHKNTIYTIRALMHSLGFSETALDYFLDENGKPRSRKTMVKETKRRDNKVIVLDVPRLTEYGKTYFNCDSFDGVEMVSTESGKMGSYFSSRLIREDIMVEHNGYYK
jgi:hypothetical protein